MTKLSRAASTTGLVTCRNELISRIRSIWVRSRFSRRKFPPVIRMMAGTASSAHGCGRPALLQQLADLGRTQWAKLMHESNSRVELRITRQPLLQSGNADQNQPNLPLVENRPDLWTGL